MSKRAKKKSVNPTPVFAVGDRIEVPKYGVGTVRVVDTRVCADYEFFYLVDFRQKGGDGSYAWLPKVKTEKQAKAVA